MNQLMSITSVQTKGVKQVLSDANGDTHAHDSREKTTKTMVNAIKGSKRKHLVECSIREEKLRKHDGDPTVVGFDISSEDDFDSDGESEENEVEKTVIESANVETAEKPKLEPANVKTTEKPKSEPANVETTENPKSKPANVKTTEKPKSKPTNVKNAEKPKLKPANVETTEKPKSKSTNVKNAEKPKYKPANIETAEKPESKPANVETAENPKTKPVVFVPVFRKPAIQEDRLKLPILSEEQAIMEAVNENPIVILSGETGSGKTTQMPQFLYEAGYTRNGRMIGVTEPRRVAAISMSQRVAQELNLSSKKVSYLIRFEGNATPETEIKFMTDGVLLKEIQMDFLLKKYSVIIIDEAHERSVYTDILIGLLSRIVPLRNKKGDPLKLIIMSATLRLEDFVDNKQLFKITPPLIKVESRQFPVTIHFNKRTDPNYVKEAFKKACKIHTQLPDGGILIFVTGQQEVNLLVKKLRKSFPFHHSKDKVNDENDVDEALDRVLKKRRRRKSNEKKIVKLPDIDLSMYGVANDDTEGDLLDELDSDEDSVDDGGEGVTSEQRPMWVLPLYSLLPGHEQAKVFAPHPEGSRLCVVATNVAETSLTIPNVKYVVDSGKVKSKVYDKHTGVSAFSVMWTSKASANQRAGRAGRTGPGHCYRLYASAVFNDMFAAWAEPDIRRRPVDDLLLQLKAMGIDRVINFPFPSPPDTLQLEAAEKRLILLGALSRKSSQDGKYTGDDSQLTKLGESMSVFPIAPRFSKMLLLSDQQPGLMQQMVALVAALSVQELLLVGERRWHEARRLSIGSGHSQHLGDMMVLLKAVAAAELVYSTQLQSFPSYCVDHGLRIKAVLEVRKLRLQLTNELNMNIKDLDLYVDPKMKAPTDLQARQLRQIVLAGMVDQVAARVSEEEAMAGGVRRGKAAYQITGTDQLVFLHSSSALYKQQPSWLVYQQVTDNGSKMHLRGVTSIEPEWLPVFAPTLCNLTPQKEPSPTYNAEKGVPFCFATGSFGPNGWQLPIMEIEYPQSLERIRWFAVFILDGSVCPKLAKYVKSLLSTPQTMVKSWASVVPRTQVLLKALADEQISSRKDLLFQWTNNSKYLLKEYLLWIPEGGHDEVTLLWPPVESEELRGISRTANKY
ncbi:probable ATP-dependent RNA helicase kurz isoform X2 [Nilaparvata lugens]|nr:probable ATP-dependent RNA helicase kurz isoform X2 [Nilaparvata lugens]